MPRTRPSLFLERLRRARSTDVRVFNVGGGGGKYTFSMNILQLVTAKGEGKKLSGQSPPGSTGGLIEGSYLHTFPGTKDRYKGDHKTSALEKHTVTGYCLHSGLSYSRDSKDNSDRGFLPFCSVATCHQIVVIC